MGSSEQTLHCWRVCVAVSIGRLNFLDRHYEEEPSGCTATAVLITDKNVLYVVCFSLVQSSDLGKCGGFTDSTWSERSCYCIVKGS